MLKAGRFLDKQGTNISAPLRWKQEKPASKARREHSQDLFSIVQLGDEVAVFGLPIEGGKGDGLCFHIVQR